MESILLILVVLGVSIQSISKKAYNEKNPSGAYSFSAASVVFALIVFLIVGKGKFEFEPRVLIYAVWFAVSYSVACVASFAAIATGSLSLTSLIIQYSLIVPSFYGLIALGEDISATLVIGLILLGISLIFVNLEGKSEKKITLKWVIFAFLAFAGNGACSTVQKAQQIEFNGMYKSELMIMALIISAIVVFAFAFFNEKKETAEHLKKGVVWYAVCGIANGLVNYFVLILSNTVPASVMFPIIAAGGIIVTALVSICLYKEKLSNQQKIGFVLGIFAIILLNL